MHESSQGLHELCEFKLLTIRIWDQETQNHTDLTAARLPRSPSLRVEALQTARRQAGKFELFAVGDSVEKGRGGRGIMMMSYDVHSCVDHAPHTCWHSASSFCTIHCTIMADLLETTHALTSIHAFSTPPSMTRLFAQDTVQECLTFLELSEAFMPVANMLQT